MENKGDDRNFLMERNFVSGTLFVTVDRKLICLEKFKKHIKLEVVFDQIDSASYDNTDVCDLKQEILEINNVPENVNKEDSFQTIDIDIGRDEEDDIPVTFQSKDRKSKKALVYEERTKSLKKSSRKRKSENFESNNSSKRSKNSHSLESKVKYSSKNRLRSQGGSKKTDPTTVTKVSKNNENKNKRSYKKRTKTTGNKPEIKKENKKELSCSYCMRNFISKREFWDHYRIKNEGYQCKDCGKKFQLRSQYIVHQKIQHDIDVPISVENNEKSDAPEKNPLSIFTTSKGTKSYKCNICDCMILLSNLRKHFWTHTNEKVFQCCVCGIEAHHLFKLQNHLRAHGLFSEMAAFDPNKNLKEWPETNDKDTDNVFIDKNKKDVDNSHKLAISCFYCLENFKGEQTFKNHCLVSTGGHSCESCGNNFKYYSDYLVHRKLVHGIEFPISQTDGISRSFSVGTDYTGLQTFRCDICHIGITSIGDLNSHMRQHISQHIYKCCVCKQNFSYFDDFTNHLATHNIRINNFKVECSYCSRKFESEEDYNAHHEVQSPTFICETCNAPHKSKAHLIVHTNLVHEMHIPLSVETDVNEYESYNTGLIGQLVCSVEKYGEDVNSYICNICKFMTKNLKILETHIMKHTGEFVYKCCVCGMQDCDSDNFSSHLSSHTHTDFRKAKTLVNVKEVDCLFCMKTFQNKIDLDSHYKLQIDVHTCDFCPRTFQYVAHLLAHCNIVHKTGLSSFSNDNRFNGILCAKENSQSGKVIYKCNICDKSFTLFRNLRRHMMQHTDENVFKCCICEFRHTHFSNFKRHQLKHSRPNSFQCKLCKIYFRNRTELSRHQSTHKIQCGLCGEEFENKPSRDYHVKVSHRNDERLQKCDQCGRLYTTEKALLDHKMRHRFSKTVQCPVCGVFVFRLDHHIKRHSKSSNSNSFSCEKCSLTFDNKESLVRHNMLSHSRKCNYSCPQCNKKFPRSGALTRHLKIHLGEKPYVCEICGKACSVRGNLRTHMRIHNKKPKLMHCNHCTLSFSLQNDLQEHIEIEHKKDILVSHPEQPYFETGVSYEMYF